jgi:hypothetical protein
MGVEGYEGNHAFILAVDSALEKEYRDCAKN